MTSVLEELKLLFDKDKLTAKNFPLTYAQREMIVICLRKSGYTNEISEDMKPIMESLKQSIIKTIEVSMAEKVTRQVFHPAEGE